MRLTHWHDAAASLAFIAFYAVSAVMVMTGLALTTTEFDSGPLAPWIGGATRFQDLFEEPHEAGFIFILLFIGVHVGALIFHHPRRERVVQAMVNGRVAPRRRLRDHDETHTEARCGYSW